MFKLEFYKENDEKVEKEKKENSKERRKGIKMINKKK